MNSMVMGSLMLPIFLILVVAPALIRKFGKRKIFIWAMSFGVAISVIQYFAGYSSLPVFLVLNASKSFGLMTPMMLSCMFTADCVEYGAYTMNKRNEGVTFSIQTFSTKLGQTFSGAIGVGLLGVLRYNAELAEQTPKALNGIWTPMTLVPAIGGLLGLIVFSIFYKLKKEDVKKMIVEMKSNEAVLKESAE